MVIITLDGGHKSLDRIDGLHVTVLGEVLARSWA